MRYRHSKQNPGYCCMYAGVMCKVPQKNTLQLRTCDRAETAKIRAIARGGLLDSVLEVIYSNLLYVL